MNAPKAAPTQGDLRVRRTRKLLWEALLALLAERPLEEITVKDICERAMAHRTTFYKHYEDKYDLLEQGMRQALDALAPPGEEHKPPSAFSIDQPPPYFVRLFEHAARHQQFYALMVCGEGNARFQRLIREKIVAMASSAAAPAGQRHDLALAMHAQYVAGATVSLLAWWLGNDMPLTPRQMAQYLLAPHGSLPTR
ncbi:MAG TPA: TetR/AcrR family transcriptional regulator C-terminal domain-containing protein [Ktedonobacterales bacterium]